MFVKRSEARSAWVGGITGALVGLYVAFWSSLGFLWPAPFGWGATLLIGWVVSLFTGRPGSEKASRWTWFAIAGRAHEE